MDSTQATLSEALAALKKRNIRKAEEGFRQVLRVDASHIAALNLLAAVLMGSGRFAEAEPFIARAVALNPNSDVSFYNYGLIAKQLSKFQLAHEQFTKALKLNPNVHETWNNRGTVSHDLNQYEAAISDFNKAIELNLNYAEAYANKGKSLIQLRRHDEALATYDKAVAIKPDLAEAWLGRGNVLADLKRYDAAIAAYDKALSIRAGLESAWLARGNVLARLKRYHDAFVAYGKALSIRPDLENAWLGLGNVLDHLKRYDEALAAYDKALAIRPDLENAWLGRGNVLADLERYDAAFAAYDKALSFSPDSENAWLGQGNVLANLKRYAEAFTAYDKALSIEPKLEGAWVGRGNAFWSLERYDEALTAYDQALSIEPELESAWIGSGNVFCNLKRYEEALAAYDKALSIKPDLANAWLGRGNALWNLKRYHEASTAYDKTLSFEPDLANAWLGRANAFVDLGRYDDALAAYDKALLIQHDLENAWLGRGNVLWGLRRLEQAVISYDEALSIKPDLENALLGRGNALADLKRFDEAFAAYDRAVALNRDFAGAEGARLHTKLNYCNWLDLDADTISIVDAIRLGKKNCAPFVALSIDVSPEDQLRCANNWLRRDTGPIKSRMAEPAPNEPDKIRIGYLSADFRMHPVAYLIAGLFEGHNGDRFTTYGFSIGLDDKSDLRRRIEKSFYKFFDLNNRSDDDILSAIESANIDILIDLTGATQGARFSVLEQRPAPILVNYLGFSGTVGGNLLDYIVADKVTVPGGSEKYYSEKIVRLPHCFMPHDAKGRIISDRLFTRRDEKLPEEGFVFCCFNNAYKINPAVFRSWMSILKRVDNSVIWLSALEEIAQDNLRNEAEKYAVAPDRLVFSSRLASSADHLARHGLADLFLDALPYNAHTTAGDALWAGLPVLTQIGNTFAGRVAAALLDAIGLPELITHSNEEYEALAIELALNREKYRVIKEKLRKNRLTKPLFDTPLFTKHLEAAYETMYRRYRAGLPPDHIEIKQ